MQLTTFPTHLQKVLIMVTNSFISNFKQRCISGSIATIIASILIVVLPLELLFTGVLVWIAVKELPVLVSPTSWFYWLLLATYLAIPFSCGFFLTKITFFIVIIFTAIFDISAYLVGSLCGKHKLAPSISPGKTWEGCIGGFFGLLFCCFLLSWPQSNFWQQCIKNILFAFCWSVVATLGDLFESWLKRRANVKDSGTLLPGHGGLLDRVDSLLFTIPAFTLFLFIAL